MPNFGNLISRGVPATVVLVLLGLALNSTQSLARGEKSRIKEKKSQQSDAHQDIKELNRKQEGVEAEIAGINDKIEEEEVRIRGTKKQLKLAEERHAKLVTECDKTEVDLENREAALGTRMRNIYMQGELTYIDLLFQSTSITDFVDRLFFVQAVCEHDEKLVSRTIKAKAELGIKLAQVQDDRQQLAEIRGTLERELAGLEGVKKSRETAIASIRSDKAQLQRVIAALDAEISALRQIAIAGSSRASGYKGKPWSGSFKQPCSGPIMSGFGYRNHPILGRRRMHTGVDIGASYGTPIKAAGSGKVIYTGWQSGYGNTVMVDHGGGRVTLYGHMSTISCSAGQEVTTSSKLGEVGSTGMSTGPHLHFEVRINGTPVNPLSNL